jgi:hypothetical protein
MFRLQQQPHELRAFPPISTKNPTHLCIYNGQFMHNVHDVGWGVGVGVGCGLSCKPMSRFCVPTGKDLGQGSTEHHTSLFNRRYFKLYVLLKTSQQSLQRNVVHSKGKIQSRNPHHVPRFSKLLSPHSAHPQMRKYQLQCSCVDSAR